MNRTEWKRKIKKSCKAAGTYKPFFDDSIDALSVILEQRDIALEQYEESGSEPVVIHTNKFGADNLSKNPCLVMWCDLNAQALAYWRDLGLTPSGLKKINDDAMKTKKQSSFADILKNEFSK